MSRREGTQPLSLAQHFTAPEGCHGVFGWIIGYSADVSFLNDAMERFTCQTAAQRASLGKISLGLLIDPSRPQISPQDVPGLLHFSMRTLQQRPFLLLHAKVSLLLFQSDTDPKNWCVRLLVSTGNWTRETLEQTLDLAWRIDFSSEHLTATRLDDQAAQVVSDLAAASDFLAWLRSLFDTQILVAAQSGREDTETSHAANRFDSVVKTIAESQRSRVAPRFFDNRKESLLGQLPQMIKRNAGPTRRNCIDLGSGFFDGQSRGAGIPHALKKIIDTLTHAGLLTTSPEVDLHVNPMACQSVANASKAILAAGWRIHSGYTNPAIYGAGSKRDLHAKFIFSSNMRARTNLCASPWLYLGSGNLTTAGFLNRMSPRGGNLEAGVVFATQDLYRQKSREAPSSALVSYCLPIQWEEASLRNRELSPGLDPEPPSVRERPPVSFLFWVGRELGGGYLKLPEPTRIEFTVLDRAGDPITADPAGRYPWPGSSPPSVSVAWRTRSGGRAVGVVPIMDEFGRIGATPIQAIEIDQAIRELGSFPHTADDAEDADGDGVDATQLEGRPYTDPVGTSARPAEPYPIRSMMLLIEQIADHQAAITEADWRTWCIRLEQTLFQMADSAALRKFLELELNPLSPLREPQFLPVFAEDRASDAWKTLDQAIARVEQKWRVMDFPGLAEASR